MIVPIAIAVSQAAGVRPIEPALGATLGASMGFMMPISTRAQRDRLQLRLRPDRPDDAVRHPARHRRLRRHRRPGRARRTAPLVAVVGQFLSCHVVHHVRGAAISEMIAISGRACAAFSRPPVRQPSWLRVIADRSRGQGRGRHVVLPGDCWRRSSRSLLRLRDGVAQGGWRLVRRARPRWFWRGPAPRFAGSRGGRTAVSASLRTWAMRSAPLRAASTARSRASSAN